MSVTRKVPLVNSEVYHVFSKSIAGFTIFRNQEEFERMRDLFSYYAEEKPELRFSSFLELKNKDEYYEKNQEKSQSLVEIVAYCLMPTHFHLILKQLKDKGISIFMSNVLNSYTRYFNGKIKRKGPLWESRFKNVNVETDEQLLHLTRYLHLNPVTAYLVEKPHDWEYSSFNEFIGAREKEDNICNHQELLEITPNLYQDFVMSQIDYQRELKEIKTLFIE